MEDQDKESDIHILFEGALHEKIGVKKQKIENQLISSQESTMTDHFYRLLKRSINPKKPAAPYMSQESREPEIIAM